MVVRYWGFLLRLPMPIRALVLVVGVLLAARSGHAGQSGAAADGSAAPVPEAAAALPFAYDGPPPPVPPAVVTRDADGRTTIRAVRLTSPLRIDGALDEAFYSTTPPISGFVQVEPNEGAAATEETDVWVAFDRDHLYITFRCWDSQPERRVATEMRRDNSMMFNGNDVVNFFLDPFYDRRNGLSFTLNSIGGRNDGQVINDQYNGDWNPIWDFAVGEFEGGWTVEIAIPFRSIRYRPGQAQIWGFNALRAVRWRNEISVLSPVPQGRGMSSAQHASLTATLVGIEAPPPSLNLDIKPYAVSTVTTDARGLPRAASDLGADLGLDVKYGITQNLVADFTYNTDFAQVEADEQQVNLTRFSLFFPEKREFFLENQGTFSFGGVNAARDSGTAPILFYSRRIGLADGHAVPIQAGGRLTGRIGSFSLGMLNIRTDEAPAADARATNFSVVRLRRDVLRRSSIGALFTGRSRAQGTEGGNTAYGIDGTFNFFTDLAINTYWARTQTRERAGDDTSYRAQLAYTGDRYGVNLERLWVGEDFNPEVGFVRRQDIRGTFGQLRFSPRPRSIPSVRRFSWTGSVGYLENGAGRVESREHSAEFAIEFQNSDRLSVAYARNYEFIPRPFRIASNVTLPVGGYEYDMVRLAFSLSPQRRVVANFTAEHGTFYNGHRTSLSASRSRLNISPRFALEPTYTVNRVELVQGSFTSHLTGSRVTYAMSPRRFASALVQYNSGNRSLGANVRFRWEYSPGSELFVVYNDERDTSGRGFPQLSTRSFIVKINRLFRL